MVYLGRRLGWYRWSDLCWHLRRQRQQSYSKNGAVLHGFYCRDCVDYGNRR